MRRAALPATSAVILASLVATGLGLAAVPSPTDAAGTSAATSGTGVPGATSDTTGASAHVRTDLADFALAKREARTTRGTSRPALGATGKPADHAKPAKSTPKPRPTVVATRYTTAALNVRIAANEDAKLLAVLKVGSKVAITGTTAGQWRQIVRDGQGVWVKKRYLASKKPSSTKPHSTSAGILSGTACKGGSAVEQGLTRDAIVVHRALCARYPQISAYGGVRQGDGGDHGSGRAVDAMIANPTVGWQIARWVRANAKRLGVSQVIYSQHIWTMQRSSEGWRPMSDRGSATANHYDHVHVTVYGNSAG